MYVSLNINTLIFFLIFAFQRMYLSVIQNLFYFIGTKSKKKTIKIKTHRIVGKTYWKHWKHEQLTVVWLFHLASICRLKATWKVTWVRTPATLYKVKVLILDSSNSIQSSNHSFIRLLAHSEQLTCFSIHTHTHKVLGVLHRTSWYCSEFWLPPEICLRGF